MCHLLEYHCFTIGSTWSNYLFLLVIAFSPPKLMLPHLLDLAFTFSLLIVYTTGWPQLWSQKNSKKQYITFHVNYLLSAVITFYVFIYLKLKCIKSEIAKSYELWQP